MAVSLKLSFRMRARVALGCRMFCTSFLTKGTHDYDAVDFNVPAQKFISFVNNPSSLDSIRKKTGTVIRPKLSNNTDEEGNTLSTLLIVGNAYQIRKATEQVQKVISGDETGASSDAMVAHVPDKFIWHGYKRNYKGQYPPVKPRKKCIRCGGKMVSGNPCPLCQLSLKSNYEVHYTDVEILKQFICPHTWNVLQPSVTGICKTQHLKVEAAIAKARMHGYIPFTLPLPSDEPKRFKAVGIPTDKNIKWKIH